MSEDGLPDFTERELESRQVYRGGLLDVREDRIRQPDGRESVREYVRHQGAVMILPLFDDGTVLLEWQYRYPPRRHFIELPAGKLEAGEEPLACARRELIEETGYEADRWRHLSTLYPCIGYSDEKIELFLAQGLRHVGHPGEEGEFLHCLRLTVGEGLEKMMRGEIDEVKTMLGLLWAERILRQA